MSGPTAGSGAFAEGKKGANSFPDRLCFNFTPDPIPLNLPFETIAIESVKNAIPRTDLDRVHLFGV